MRPDYYTLKHCEVCCVFQVWLLLTGMNELDKNRLNSKHNSLLVNETSVTDSTEEEIKCR